MTHEIQHIAIVMDGNRRWALERGLPSLKGHETGMATVKRIVEATVERRIPYLTIYAFSLENWKRDPGEVSGLFSLMEWGFSREMRALHENNIKVVIVGDRKGLPEKTLALVEEAESLTQHNTALQLNVALNYGGRQEILSAVRSVVSAIQQGALKTEDLNEKTFETFLQTQGIPDPDVFIRSSGEMRISNFLLWQLSYSELFFTKTDWPDFSKEEYFQILDSYQQRNRRFGEGSYT